VGDGVADDTAAIRAAHDYCAGLTNGGDVILDGAFRVTDTLTWAGKVSLVGTGNCSLFFDHPTKDWFSITGSITTPTRFENFYLAAAQPNTGTVFLCGTAVGSTPQRILIRNVMSNLNPESNFVRGTIVYAGVSNQKVTVENCTLNVAAATPACTVTGGSLLVINDSSFSPPGTSSTMMIEVRTGSYALITNSSFIGRPGGGVGGVFVYTNTGGTSTVSNCTFKGDGLTGTLWYAFGWAAGATVITENNFFDAGSLPVNSNSPPPTLTAPVADRLSKVDLLQGYKLLLLGNIYNTLSGYRFIELGANGTSFTVNMPGKLFLGQRLTISVKNNSGGTNWAPTFSGAGIPTNMAPPAVLNWNVQGYGVYEFIVSDLFSGTPSWVMTNNGQ
jgi:hypothetical protein